MLKNKLTGFMEAELSIIPIESGAELITGAYVSEDGDGLSVHIFLTCEGDLSDAEFDRVFDEYGDGCDLDVDEIIEAEDCYNPTWEMVFAYTADRDALAARIGALISAHMAELERIMSK